MMTEKEAFEKLSKDANKVAEEITALIENHLANDDDQNAIFAVGIGLAAVTCHVIERAEELVPGQDHLHGFMDLINAYVGDKFKSEKS